MKPWNRWTFFCTNIIKLLTVYLYKLKNGFMVLCQNGVDFQRNSRSYILTQDKYFELIKSEHG